MRLESLRSPLRCCPFFAPTVEVCLQPVVWSDVTSFRPPFSVSVIIFLDTTPQIHAGWMGQMRPG